MKHFLNFFSAFLFYNFFFNLEQNRNSEATTENLENLAGDFAKIGFPFEINLSYIFSSVIISIFILFMFSNSSRSFKNNDLNDFFNKLIYYFFVNAGSLFAILYFLRFYNFSRLFLLLNLIIFPMYMLFINYIFEKSNFIKYLLLAILLIMNILFLVFVFNADSTSVGLNSQQGIDSENIVGFLYEDEGTCNEWLGSENYRECRTGTTYSVFDNLNTRTSNLLIKNNNLYVLTSVGVIYVYEDLKNEKKLFLDISEKVFYDLEFFESGLFSLAFHPTENYFLVSYSNKENNLTIEKFFLDNNDMVENTSEIVLKIPTSDCCHYSGNIIWSDYFQDFLISVGDMGNKFNATNTTNPKGKVILLNKSFLPGNIPLISDIALSRQLENIVAFGLRNPWKTYEYNGRLFVPDIGFNDVEELNVLVLNELDSPPFLGWPIYEGNLDRYERFFPQFYFNENNSINLKEYALENSYSPNVFYNHKSESVYRGALIGGGVIQNKTSIYFENYIFADYISKELFSYDFINNSLIVLPLPDNFSSYISSLIVNPLKANSVIVSTGAGDIIEIDLP